MNYLDQINRAIDYIEEHLNEDLAIDEISREAGISKWHFQRVFRAVLNETVKDYTLQRRLSLAAQALLTTNKTILEIALGFNFDSHEVFTRAFKRHFKATPSEYRQNKDRSPIPEKPKVTFEYISHLYKGVSMEPKIIKCGSLTLRGVSGQINHVNSPEFSENLSIIPKLWRDLRAVIGSSDYQKVSMIDSDLDYFAGVAVEEEKEFENLERRVIPSGEYAEFVHRGPMSGINHTMNYIYGSWFPKSGRLRGNGPDVSFHTDKTDPTAADNEIRILIPLI